MLEAKRLVVNVVTWNSMAYVTRLMESLRVQDTTDFTVTVVDNASNDGLVAWLKDECPSVVILRNIRNLGFARAHNQAIELALSRWERDDLNNRYVLVTNPDLEFAPNTIRLLMAYMDAHPDVAACGPKLLRAFVNNVESEEFDVTRSDVIDSTGLVIYKSRRMVDRGAGETDSGQYDQGGEVFGLSGACVLFRASALLDSKLGTEFFDEDFFAYYEDVDLAWRMRNMGLRSHLVPQAAAWHFRSAKSIPNAGWLASWKFRRTKSPFINFLSSRNHGWVLVKNEDIVNAIIHLPWWLPYEFCKAIAGLFSLSQLKGQLASVVGVPKMIKKRFALSKRSVAGSGYVRKWFV
jgi:GT2 family glycosyltransferase